MIKMYYHGLLSYPGCDHCPLRGSRIVYPDGPVPADIAIVGEGPGRDEEIDGKGLVGPTGKLTWLLAESVGLKREMCWISNGSLCFPKKIRLQSGVVLEKERVKVLAAAACRQRLVEELRVVNPRVIIPMGNLALWALQDLPNAKITNYRGSISQIDLDELARQIATGQTRSIIPPQRKN